MKGTIIDFTDMIHAIRRRWYYVVGSVVVAGLLGAAMVQTATPMYQASARAYVKIPFGATANELAQSSNYAQQQLSTYALLATSSTVLTEVIDELDLDETPKSLASRVSAMASKETVLLDVTVTSEDPQEAANVANSVVKQLNTEVKVVSPPGADGESTVEIISVTEAVKPSAPVSPNKKRDVGASIMGGLFLGLLAAFLRDRLDTRVRGRSDLPKDVTLLGSVPFDKSVRASGPAALESPDAWLRAEAYRRARTTLQFADVDDRRVQVIAVTSALPKEGKTSSAINLAQVFARSGERTLLIDADLRRARVADYLGLVGSVGLVDTLIGRVALDEVLQQAFDENLTILPAGTTPPNPTELLGSSAMRELMIELRERFDVIIVDTPPLVPVVDAAIVAPLADGALVVSKVGRATRAQLDSVVTALGAVDARVFGVLLTCVRARRSSRRSAYGYYEDTPDPRGKAPGRPAPPKGAFALSPARHAPGQHAAPASSRRPVAPAPPSPTPPDPRPPVPAGFPPVRSGPEDSPVSRGPVASAPVATAPSPIGRVEPAPPPEFPVVASVGSTPVVAPVDSTIPAQRHVKISGAPPRGRPTSPTTRVNPLAAQALPVVAPAHETAGTSGGSGRSRVVISSASRGASAERTATPRPSDDTADRPTPSVAPVPSDRSRTAPRPIRPVDAGPAQSRVIPLPLDGGSRRWG